MPDGDTFTNEYRVLILKWAARLCPARSQKSHPISPDRYQWWLFSRDFVRVTTKISGSMSFFLVRTTCSHAGKIKGCVMVDFWQNEPDVL
jgi:hypothetical protein